MISEQLEYLSKSLTRMNVVKLLTAFLCFPLNLGGKKKSKKQIDMFEKYCITFACGRCIDDFFVNMSTRQRDSICPMPQVKNFNCK